MTHLSRNDSHCLPRIIPCLYDREELQLKALSEMHNLLRRESKIYTHDLISLDVVASVVPMLLKGTPQVKTMACKLLAKLAEDARSCGPIIGQENLMQGLLESLKASSDELKIEATRLVAQLCKHESSRQQIATHEVINALVPCLLPSAKESLQEWALMCVQLVSEVETNHEILINAGAIAPLIHFLSSTSTFSILEYAADTIETLSSNPKTREVIIEAGGVEALVALLSGHPSIQAHALITLVNLSVDAKACSEIVSVGGIKALTALIHSSEEVTQEQVAHLLVKLASRRDLREASVTRLIDGVPLFVNLLEGRSSVPLKEHSLDLILLMADNDSVKETFAACGGVGALLSLISAASCPAPQKQRALAILSKMATDESNAIALINSGGVRWVVGELASSDHGVQLQAVLVLTALSCSDKISGAIPAVGGIVALIPLLASPYMEIQINTVRTLSNLCSSVVCREGFHAGRGIIHLPPLLSYENEALCFESLRLAVILCSEPKVRASAVSCIPPLVAILKHSQQSPLLEQSMFLLLCFSRDSSENRRAILEYGGLSGIVPLLSSPTSHIQLMAAEVVALVSSVPASHSTLRQESTVTTLVELLLTTDAQQLQEYALTILAAIDLGEEEGGVVHNSGGLLAIVSILASANLSMRLPCLVVLAKLSEFAKYRKGIIAAGATEQIIGILAAKEQRDSQCMVYSVTCLEALSAEEDSAEPFEAAKGLSVMFGLLEDNSVEGDLQQRIVTLLVNLCHHEEDNWERFKKEMGLSGLLFFTRANNKTAQSMAAAELSSISSDEEQQSKIVEAGGVNSLVNLLLSDAPSVRRNVTGAIANLSREPTLWKAILAKDAIAPLVTGVKEGGLVSRNSLLTLAHMAVSSDCWSALCAHQLPALFIKSLAITSSDESEVSY